MCEYKKEELDWLDPSLHFLLVSTEISKSIEDEAGAKVYFENKHLFVEGNTESREKAKDIILEKVYERNAVLEENEINNRTANQINAAGGDDHGCWDVIEFVDSKYFAEIIGRNGDHIRKLEKKFGLKIKKDKQKNKIIIKGGQESKNEAIFWFQNFIASKDSDHPNPEGETRKGSLEDDESWETVDFLEPKYFGKIIGKNGYHIKRLEKRFGLQMKKDEQQNKIVMKGNEESKNEALVWFQDFVASKEFKKSKSEENESTNSIDEDEWWESVDFLHPKYFGKIIGKGGQHIKELQKKFNVKMRKDELKNKIVMKGDKKAKEDAMQYFRDFVSVAESNKTPDTSVKKKVLKEGIEELNINKVDAEDEELIDFVSQKFFGSIIGQNGANIRRLQREYGVSLRIDKSVNKLMLKGGEVNKTKLKDYLRKYVSKSSEYTKISQLREVFFVGMQENDEVKLRAAKSCDNARHMEIYSFKNTLPLDKCYENIPKLKESLLNAVCVAKINMETIEMRFVTS